MTLDDPVIEEWYSFNRNGFVCVTYGEKNGWVAAPLFLWKVQEGRLIIFDTDKKIFQTLTLISQDEKTLTVKNKSGKVVVFKKQKA